MLLTVAPFAAMTIIRIVQYILVLLYSNNLIQCQSMKNLVKTSLRNSVEKLILYLFHSFLYIFIK